MGALKSITWVILIVFEWQVMAHEPADGHVYATFGEMISKHHTRQHEIGSPLFGNFGVIAEGDVDYNGGIEIGAFFVQQLHSIQREGLVVAEKGNRMYITMGYRHWATSRLSGAVAFFSSYSMGDPVVMRNDWKTNDPPATSARDTTEYGFDFSIQLEPWRKDRFSMVIDARYSLSVTPKSGEDSNFFGILAGLKYFIQARE
jgi:hypothetical protein